MYLDQNAFTMRLQPKTRSSGRRCAVLNLDFMHQLIDLVKDAPAGQRFISNCIRWNDAIHNLNPRPLIIFTALSFTTAAQPELADGSPFSNLIQAFGGFEKSLPGAQIDSRFTIDEKDIALDKTRWFAGSGNSLVQILRAQNIDTVILVKSTWAGYPKGKVANNYLTGWIEPIWCHYEHSLSAL